MVKTLAGHEDGVTSMLCDCTSSASHLLTAGNDGSLRLWDVRKNECVDQTQAHKAKYEEAALALCSLPPLNMVASGGADSAINLFLINERI